MGYFYAMNLHTLIRYLAPRKAVDNRVDRGSVAHSATRFLHGFLLLLTIAAVSGCASKDGIRVPGPAATVSNENAFALPPPGGPAIVNVVQHDFNNAVQQDIYLFT